VQEWLEKAEEDTRAAEILRDAGGPWSVASYHVQQAAEKYIKAALVSSGTVPPKTHDLSYLLGLDPTGMVTASEQGAATNLTSYAWLSRYPGSAPVQADDVAQAFQDLEVLMNWALRRIGP
jgi:HEPN domain-containing protein